MVLVAGAGFGASNFSLVITFDVSASICRKQYPKPGLSFCLKHSASTAEPRSPLRRERRKKKNIYKNTSITKLTGRVPIPSGGVGMYIEGGERGAARVREHFKVLPHCDKSLDGLQFRRQFVRVVGWMFTGSWC